MQTIRKQTEPTFLARYRSMKDADWDRDVQRSERDEARRRLCAEQGSLCCFCEGRIRANRDDMKIAHFIPQDENPLMFAWSNLLGACKGGEGNPPKEQHCYTRQANRKLSAWLDPVKLAPATINFNINFEISATQLEAKIDMNEKLNLNLKKIVRNRRSAAEAMIEKMGKESWKEADIERKLKELSSPAAAERIEYQSYLIWWLQRRLRKSG